MKITTKKITYAGLLIAIGRPAAADISYFWPAGGKGVFANSYLRFFRRADPGTAVRAGIRYHHAMAELVIDRNAAMPQAVFMVFELSAYGVCAGLFRKKCNVYISLILAQVCGRAAYGLILFAAGQLLSVNVPAVYGIWTAFIAGLPGIVIQLILIPLAVRLLERGGVLEFERTEKPPV